jgi:hypothetical protein
VEKIFEELEAQLHRKRDEGCGIQKFGFSPRQDKRIAAYIGKKNYGNGNTQIDCWN